MKWNIVINLSFILGAILSYLLALEAVDLAIEFKLHWIICILSACVGFVIGLILPPVLTAKLYDKINKLR
ncbi:hypothetical protein GYB57_02245 [bacterium]|nr:hypothetical protein [bacterium]